MNRTTAPHYVGIPGALTADWRAALTAAGVDFTPMGKTATLGTFESDAPSVNPVDENEREWIKFAARDEQDARSRVAAALGIDEGELLVQAPRPGVAA